MALSLLFELFKRLKELQQMELSRDQLLLKLGAAKARFPAAWRLVDSEVAEQEEPLEAHALKRSLLEIHPLPPHEVA